MNYDKDPQERSSSRLQLFSHLSGEPHDAVATPLPIISLCLAKSLEELVTHDHLGLIEIDRSLQLLSTQSLS